MHTKPRNDLEYSQSRLDRLLSSRRLIFNPYTVSDRRLLYIIERTEWGDEFDLVQAVVMTFARLRTVNDYRGYDGIYAKVGPYDGEAFIYASSMAYGVTADDSLHRERSMIGKKRITNHDHIASLVGKRVFVSRKIAGSGLRSYQQCTYKMTKLSGNEAKDAAAVRKAMCEAKIEMLNRILENPNCEQYLNCSKDFFDYRARILRAIRIIEGYPLVQIPKI